MSNEKNRILSYKLASTLDHSDLEKVSGGKKGDSGPRGTIGTQRPRSTQGGKTDKGCIYFKIKSI